MSCPICDGPVPPGRGRRYCSPTCRKQSELSVRRERKVQACRAAVGDIGETTDRAEVLSLLWGAARLGSVAAMRILLTELGRDGEDTAEAPGIIDELATKREKAGRIG